VPGLGQPDKALVASGGLIDALHDAIITEVRHVLGAGGGRCCEG
jgi:hypothetical protein